MDSDPCAIGPWLPWLVVLLVMATIGIALSSLVVKGSRAAIVGRGRSALRWIAVGIAGVGVLALAYVGWAILTVTFMSRSIDGC